jgi:hypothetical protein
MSLHAMFVGGPTWETIGLGKHGSWTHESLLMRLPSQNTGNASRSLKLPSSGNIISPTQFSTLVGDLTCLGQKFYNDTAQETHCWGAPNHTEAQPHPLNNFSNLQKAWDNLTANIDWQAPRELYWICGKQAHMVLPRS